MVEIVGVKNPEQKRYYTTEYGGYFRIVNVPNGDYKGSISFIGYGKKEFTFRVAGLPINVGTLRIAVSAIGIETVVKTAVSKRTTILGDTLRYNADAFKVAIDAEGGGFVAQDARYNYL